MNRTSIAAALAATAVALPLAAIARPAGATTSPAPVTYLPLDPATWSNGQLAAQLTFVCIDAAATSAQRSLASQGIGGISMIGNDAPSDLGSRLASVRSAAPHGIPPLIASDEEGGAVQRLTKLIYPLPSAETMGTWSTTKIRSTAYHYAEHMKALGVPMDFAPVADLGIPGYYIESLHRAFSRWPEHVSADIDAWIHGMRAAGVATTVKHWPGHGQATNTHTGSATVPPLSTLESRDMIPFNHAFSIDVPAVMVGHLMSDGLTEPGWPASESPHALAYLRRHARPTTLIVTDSLSMAAASSAVGLTVPQAAVRALRSGADIALTCESSGVIAAVTKAIGNGTISRARAVASVRRLLPLKARAGLLRNYGGPWGTTMRVAVGAGHVAVGGTDTFYGRLKGGYRTVEIQRYSGGAWHQVHTVTAGQYGYFRWKLPTGTAGTYHYRAFAPWSFPYASHTSAGLTVQVG